MHLVGYLFGVESYSVVKASHPLSVIAGSPQHLRHLAGKPRRAVCAATLAVWGNSTPAPPQHLGFLGTRQRTTSH